MTPLLLFTICIAIDIVSCILIDRYARSKGRTGFFWISFLLTAPVGLLIALVVDRNPENLEKWNLQKGSSKKCPACAEAVKSEASVCRYCGFSFANSPTTPEVREEMRVRVAQDGEEFGTMGVSEIRQNVSAGILRREDFYFDEHSNDWMPLELLIGVR